MEVAVSNIRIIRRPYSKKRLPKVKPGKCHVVSTYLFKNDLGIFDPEMKATYTNKQIVAVMKLIFKKVVERIIIKLWQMPFPNGMGRLYMKEAQVDRRNYDDPNMSDQTIENLLRECQLGMKGSRLKWNKEHTRFPYRDIWDASKSKGFFRSCFFNEVMSRAEDPTKKNYRGHII